MPHPLLERAQAQGTPLIAGESATFLWRGRAAPQLIGDFTDWEEAPLTLERVAPGLWARTLPFPTDAYIEYAYSRAHERLPDPLNSRTTPDGLGHVNHFFYMPAGAPTPLARWQRGIARGTLTRHTVATDGLAAGRQRTVHLYRPPTAGPCPLVVVLDGNDYLRRGRIVPIVDNLIALGRIRPIAMALVQHGGPARIVEYTCSEATVGFLLERVLPLAQAGLDLLDLRAFPGAYGLLGASMGGLLALYAALRVPATFGHVLSQSGAFGWQERGFVVFDLLQEGPLRPLKVWLDVGRFEPLLAINQRLHALLATRGYDVSYREYNGGHNYPSWRNDVGRGLEWLFGVSSPARAPR